jgi:hypothetical protein
MNASKPYLQFLPFQSKYGELSRTSTSDFEGNPGRFIYNSPMLYSHTQNSPLFWLMLPIPVMELGALLFWPLPVPGRVVILASAAFITLIGWSFSSLHVQDQENELAVWFGNFPLVGTRIVYSEIETFEHDQSRWFDGWGLHYTRTGWLYNVWGFDGVRIRTRNRSIRIGTDDAIGLMTLLRERTGHEPS